MASGPEVDLKRMRMVVEVARAEAITTAAESLGLTQSAVSRGVAEVEEALGVRLFDRLPRGSQLTEAGHRFVARARRVLNEVDDLVVEARNDTGSISGRIRVGVISSGAAGTWVLASFARQYHEVAIETSAGTPQSLCPRLLHGEIDLIVGSANYLRRWRELEVTILAPLHFACMMRKNHPLSERQRPSEVEVLRHPVILPETVEPTYSDIAQRFAYHGLPRFQPHYVTDDFGLVRRLVDRTNAFYPLMHPRPDFGGLEREFFMLRGAVDMPTHHVSYARAAHRPRSGAVAALEELLIERLGA